MKVGMLSRYPSPVPCTLCGAPCNARWIPNASMPVFPAVLLWRSTFVLSQVLSLCYREWEIETTWAIPLSQRHLCKFRWEHWLTKERNSVSCPSGLIINWKRANSGELSMCLDLEKALAEGLIAMENPRNSSLSQRTLWHFPSLAWEKGSLPQIVLGRDCTGNSAVLIAVIARSFGLATLLSLCLVRSSTRTMSCKYWPPWG